MSKVVRNRIMICGLILSVVICGMSVVAACPSIKFKNYLDQDQCNKVVNVYNQSFVGTSDEEKYADILLEYIKETKNRWRDGELEYKDAVANLKALIEVEQEEVSYEAKQMSVFIEREGFGNECYESAMSYMHNKDYIEAMKILRKIDDKYLMYEDVLILSNTCKEAILKETKNLKTISELEAAIQRMDEYFQMVPEAAFAVRKGQLEKELVELKDVIGIVKEASEYYDAGDYKTAFQILETGMEKYPKNSKMKDGYMMYLELFVTKTAEEAKEACERKAYGEAREIVENALEMHDCEPLRQVLEYVKEEGNVLYKWWNDIKGFLGKWQKH